MEYGFNPDLESGHYSIIVGMIGQVPCATYMADGSIDQGLGSPIPPPFWGSIALLRSPTTT